DYRFFLEHHGNLAIDGCYLEYEGVRHEESGTVLSVVEYTRRCRTAGLPDTYLVFASDEDREYYCLNTEFPGEVRLFDPATGTLGIPCAAGFFECVLEDIRGIDKTENPENTTTD
ncbi:MAG: SMI1/KNR4 family protein, partial [Planctomycetia bacterium]|nr:SMI1/KNR4 family protein [Planctomycetia bacterium]